jgi:hypothetical protein
MTLRLNQKKTQLGVILPVSISMLLSLAGDLTLYIVLPIHFINLGFTLAMTGILLSANRLIRLGSKQSPVMRQTGAEEPRWAH